jgi:hypothetical protein
VAPTHAVLKQEGVLQLEVDALQDHSVAHCNVREVNAVMQMGLTAAVAQSAVQVHVLEDIAFHAHQTEEHAVQTAIAAADIARVLRAMRKDAAVPPPQQMDGMVVVTQQVVVMMPALHTGIITVMAPVTYNMRQQARKTVMVLIHAAISVAVLHFIHTWTIM